MIPQLHRQKVQQGSISRNDLCGGNADPAAVVRYDNQRNCRIDRIVPDCGCLLRYTGGFDIYYIL